MFFVYIFYCAETVGFLNLFCLYKLTDDTYFMRK